MSIEQMIGMKIKAVICFLREMGRQDLIDRINHAYTRGDYQSLKAVMDETGPVVKAELARVRMAAQQDDGYENVTDRWDRGERPLPRSHVFCQRVFA